ncbi:hypothetical protein [Massilia sp. 9I]|uniref:hypothetical protein n=1 Tax=Massilia sp. 9I TaxID=2653152 RepID=UPI0012EF2174|nr:hypothetical protein [Massilia sp. 9I]VXB47690.1 conserved hypothetical protein [Massilia sp. 9I]
MEHESHHHHHPHGTGLRWLDISLGVAAGIVSLVSLWLGLHSAHEMEKLVAANSFPYLEMMRNMSSIDKEPGSEHSRKRVEYLLVNSGIGPARIEWVQLHYKGKPMADLSALLAACCTIDGSADVAMNRRGNVVGSLVRPGDMMSMFAANEPATPNPVFDALHRSMGDINTTACYCSVFDECYLREKDKLKPTPVDQCTPPKVPFRPDFK